MKLNIYWLKLKFYNRWRIKPNVKLSFNPISDKKDYISEIKNFGNVEPSLELGHINQTKIRLTNSYLFVLF